MTSFIHTWSKLSAFEQCPRQFEYRYILKKDKAPPSEQILWGNQVHKAMEDRVLERELTPLPSSMQVYQKYVDAALIAKERGLEVRPEWEVAIDRESSPCGYWSKEAWIRGKIDLSILAPTSGLLQDYKTGKWKSEVGQLQLNSWLAMANRPELQVVETRYLWMQGGDQLKRTYTRDDIGMPNAATLPQIIKVFTPRLLRIEAAIDSGVFNPQPSGLCKKHCAVLDCEHNGRSE